MFNLLIFSHITPAIHIDIVSYDKCMLTLLCPMIVEHPDWPVESIIFFLLFRNNQVVVYFPVIRLPDS